MLPHSISPESKKQFQFLQQVNQISNLSRFIGTPPNNIYPCTSSINCRRTSIASFSDNSFFRLPDLHFCNKNKITTCKRKTYNVESCWNSITRTVLNDTTFGMKITTNFICCSICSILFWISSVIWIYSENEVLTGGNFFCGNHNGIILQYVFYVSEWQCLHKYDHWSWYFFSYWY